MGKGSLISAGKFMTSPLASLVVREKRSCQSLKILEMIKLN